MTILTAEDLDDDWDDDPEPIYCQMCLKRGYQNRLGPKILMPGQVREEDYENFLECAGCGWICPIFAVEKEAEIKNTIETQSSPYDDKFQFVSIPTRAAEKGRKARPKRIKKDKNILHEDKEINEEMRRHGTDNVRVVFDSGTD
jgi:hypothetical protein